MISDELKSIAAIAVGFAVSATAKHYSNTAGDQLGKLPFVGEYLEKSAPLAVHGMLGLAAVLALKGEWRVGVLTGLMTGALVCNLRATPKTDVSGWNTLTAERGHFG